MVVLWNSHTVTQSRWWFWLNQIKQSLSSIETSQGLFHSLKCTPPQCKQISFGIKNESEVQGQPSSELIEIFRVLKCICGPNLEILTSIGSEYWREQAQNGVNFEFEVKFDLEGQGQSPPKTIGILTKVFYTHGPNLVILASTGDELSRGQVSDYRTHGRTDGRTHRQTQATTIPEGQNWPRVKMSISVRCLRCQYLKDITRNFAMHAIHWMSQWA